MTYRDDDAEARVADAIAELELRLAKLEQDRAALDRAGRGQWLAGLPRLKKPLVIVTLFLALGAGFSIGHELGRKRILSVDFCPPGTPAPEGMRKR
jgi:hypothetical protein